MTPREHPCDCDLTDDHGEAAELRRRLEARSNSAGDLISRAAVLAIFQPERSAVRKRICDDIRSIPASQPQGEDKQIYADPVSSAPNLREAARYGLELWDASPESLPPGGRDAKHQMIVAALFAAQAYEDGLAANADGATGQLLRAFLLALVDPRHADLDPLRACNRKPVPGPVEAAALDLTGGPPILDTQSLIQAGMKAHASLCRDIGDGVTLDRTLVGDLTAALARAAAPAMEAEPVNLGRCATCGADLSVTRMVACCQNPKPTFPHPQDAESLRGEVAGLREQLVAASEIEAKLEARVAELEEILRDIDYFGRIEAQAGQAGILQAINRARSAIGSPPLLATAGIRAALTEGDEG